MPGTPEDENGLLVTPPASPLPPLSPPLTASLVLPPGGNIILLLKEETNGGTIPLPLSLSSTPNIALRGVSEETPRDPLLGTATLEVTGMVIEGILVTPVLPRFLNPASGRAGDGFRLISSSLAALFTGEEGTELEPTGIAWTPADVGEDEIEVFLGPESSTCSWSASP